MRNTTTTPKLKTTPKPCCPKVTIKCHQSYCPGSSDSIGVYSMVFGSHDCPDQAPYTVYRNQASSITPVFLYRNKYKRWATSVMVCDSLALIASKYPTSKCPEDVPDHGWVYIEDDKEHDAPDLVVSCYNPPPRTTTTTTTVTPWTTPSYRTTPQADPNDKSIIVIIGGTFFFSTMLLIIACWICTKGNACGPRTNDIQGGLDNPAYQPNVPPPTLPGRTLG